MVQTKHSELAVKPRRRIPGGKGGTLTPYNKGESGNPAGSKKSQLTLLREEFEINYDWKISKHDAEQLLKLLAFAPISELHKLYANPHLPAVIANFIKALLNDIKLGRINTASAIVEFNYGKATQKIEVEDKTERPTTLSSFTQEDLLLGIKHAFYNLELEGLEKVYEMLDGEVQKKRSEDAKIINQPD